MNYNLFIRTQGETFNILDASESELIKIIDIYKYGKDSLFLRGQKIWFSDLLEIQILTFEHDRLKSEKELVEYCNKNDFFDHDFFESEWLPMEILEKIGKRVTEQFITEDFGYLKDVRLVKESNDIYVEFERIDEINSLEDKDFDYTKLIAFLKELNVAYSHGLFLSIPPLVRSVIDHIPPVFGKANFADVCGSHGTKSFKDSMKNLNNSSRKIADSYLHSQIRKNETLPNKTQINFKNDLDVLLQEIVRIREK